jgi:hypothetical protein
MCDKIPYLMNDTISHPTSRKRASSLNPAKAQNAYSKNSIHVLLIYGPVTSYITPPITTAVPKLIAAKALRVTRTMERSNTKLIEWPAQARRGKSP